MDDVQRVADAVAALDPQPREKRWTSLTYCVVDSVWSINANYTSVVAPVVRAVASAFGDQAPLSPANRPLPDDPVPVHAFLDRFNDGTALVQLTNRQRTSTHNGVLKADAALVYARILGAHGVQTLGEAQGLLDDEARLAEVEAELRTVPGEGQHGVRRGYLWMLVGSEEHIKPDRMVLRWFRDQGVVTDPAGAKRLVYEIAAYLTSNGRPTTPWVVDHAIWLTRRGR
ncbi:hypothetical protein [Phytoactinopolyspora endophytica]|uniref:hypothetical protein n=1 Tax=Phytoactinopolyspora endophytica TaxID=1642495 RepID=UPI00197B3F74|nr:hypothetical protein [Phytoactinopolyspora endophytica]